MEEYLIYIISAISGLLGMPLIQAIKKWLKVEDTSALLVASVVSLILSFVVNIANGQLVGGEVTMDNIIKAAGVVFYTANLFYRVIVSYPQKEK